MNSLYPFGLNISSLSDVWGAYGNEYFYQSKEKDNELGLNWLNFEARMYDAELGRWNVQDPALQYSSPYLTMGNNLVIITDPNGTWGGYDDNYLRTWGAQHSWNWETTLEMAKIYGMIPSDGNDLFQRRWTYFPNSGKWVMQEGNEFSLFGNGEHHDFAVVNGHIGIYNYVGTEVTKLPTALTSDRFFVTIEENWNFVAIGDSQDKWTNEFFNNNYSRGLDISFGLGLFNGVYGQAAKGLTETTSKVASEVQAARNIGNIATVAKVSGYLGNTLSLAANAVMVMKDPSAENYERLGDNVVAVSLNLVPGFGTGLSLIVSTVDAAGGFNWLYESLE